MTNGPRAAATADKVTADAIRAARARPDELEPDPVGNVSQDAGREADAVRLVHVGSRICCAVARSRGLLMSLRGTFDEGRPGVRRPRPLVRGPPPGSSRAPRRGGLPPSRRGRNDNSRTGQSLRCRAPTLGRDAGSMITLYAEPLPSLPPAIRGRGSVRHPNVARQHALTELPRFPRPGQPASLARPFGAAGPRGPDRTLSLGIA
jgi:hypothetical protein